MYVPAQPPVAAENVIASANVWKTMENPPIVGRVRHKMWRWLIPPAGEADTVWAERCRAYWELQERTYGLKMSNFTLAIDWDEGVLITYAVVEAILPGRRLTASEYAAAIAVRH